MENIIIIKEDGRAINSDMHFDYSIVITSFGVTETFEDPDGNTVEEQAEPPTIQFRATAVGTAETVLISTFYEPQEAADALIGLMSTFESELEIFDVRDYNSNV